MNMSPYTVKTYNFNISNSRQIRAHLMIKVVMDTKPEKHM